MIPNMVFVSYKMCDFVSYYFRKINFVEISFFIIWIMIGIEKNFNVLEFEIFALHTYDTMRF